MSIRRLARRRSPRWALVMLVAYLLAIVAVLLLPVGYSGVIFAIGDWLRAHLGLGWFGYGWIEFTANVALFLPLGVLATLMVARHWGAVLLALALSAGAELLQLVVPGRQASLRDIVANVLGAAIGAGIAGAIVSRRERARLGRARVSRGGH